MTGGADGEAGDGFETRAIHAGQDPDPATGAVVAADPPRRRRSRRTRWASTAASSTRRSGNPTRAAFEACLASLEGATHAASRSRAAWPRRTRCCGCSRPATTCVHPRRRVRRHVPAGRAGARTRGRASTASPTSPTSTRPRAAWQDGTTMVWIETPTNPTLGVVDIAAVAELAHAARRARRRRQHVRDAVPAAAARARRRHRRALDHEVPRRPLRRRRRVRRGHERSRGRASGSAFLQNAIGAVPSPFDCYLVLRGIKTLGGAHGPALRERAGRRRPCSMAHPAVSRVLYPGLADHPGHDIAARQMRDFGGMVSLPRRGRRGRRARRGGARRGCSRWRSRSAPSSRSSSTPPA